MANTNSFVISEDLKKRAEEIRQRAEAEELLRIGEAEKRVAEFARNRYQDLFREYEAKLSEAEIHRKNSENVLLEREFSIKRLLKIERARKIEIRKHNEEERQKQLQEAQRRREEEERLRIEQERKKFEEERLRQIEEEKRRLEEERRYREELERISREEEKARREAEEARKKEEREIRIHTMLEEAKLFLEKGDYDRALIEIAKALVHDPNHPEALALRKKIQSTYKVFEPVAEEKIEKEEVEKKIEKTTEIKHPPPQFKTPRKIPWLALSIVAAVVVGIIISQLIPIIFPPTPSIAIRSFKSNTAILEDDILGKALSEEITNRLVTIPQFQIMGFTSIRMLENYSNNIDNLIVAAGFSYQLEGVISRSEKQRVIDLTLKDSANNVIWKKRIQKDENLIIEIPAEICKEIVNEFQIEVPNENHEAYRISTNNNTAFLMYLRGIELLNRNTPESCENAEQLFDYAASEDNSFTDAFAASGYASILKIDNGWNKSKKVFAKADDMLQRAAISAYKSVPTKRYIGLMNIYNHKFNTAHSELNDLIKLYPHISENYTAISKLYLLTGKYSDAIDALTKAYNLDPFNPEIIKLMTAAHQLKQEYNEAFSIYNRYIPIIKDSATYISNYVANTIMSDPTLMIKYSYRLVRVFENLIMQNPKDYESKYKLARLYQSIGQSTDAMPLLISALNLVELELKKNPNDATLEIYRALINTRMGRFAEAERLSQRAIALAPDNYEVMYKCARMYAIQVGRSDTIKIASKSKSNHAQLFGKALDKLQKAVSLHYSTEELLDIDFYNLHNRPEFFGVIKLREK